MCLSHKWRGVTGSLNSGFRHGMSNHFSPIFVSFDEKVQQIMRAKLGTKTKHKLTYKYSIIAKRNPSDRRNLVPFSLAYEDGTIQQNPRPKVLDNNGYFPSDRFDVWLISKPKDVQFTCSYRGFYFFFSVAVFNYDSILTTPFSHSFSLSFFFDCNVSLLYEYDCPEKFYLTSTSNRRTSKGANQRYSPYSNILQSPSASPYSPPSSPSSPSYSSSSSPLPAFPYIPSSPYSPSSPASSSSPSLPSSPSPPPYPYLSNFTNTYPVLDSSSLDSSLGYSSPYSDSSFNSPLGSPLDSPSSPLCLDSSLESLFEYPLSPSSSSPSSCPSSPSHSELDFSSGDSLDYDLSDYLVYHYPYPPSQDEEIENNFINSLLN